MPDQKAKAVDVGGGSGKVEVGGGKLESQDGRRSGRSVYDVVEVEVVEDDDKNWTPRTRIAASKSQQEARGILVKRIYINKK